MAATSSMKRFSRNRLRVEGESTGSGGRSVSDRPDGERDQRELHARLPARVQRGEVAVDVLGDLLRRQHLPAPLDHHLGERHEAEESERMQVAQPVPGAHGRRPPGGEPDGQHDVDRHPAAEHHGRRHVDAEHVLLRRAAPDQCGDLTDHERDVTARDHQRRPAEPPHVGRAEHRQRHEQHVLGERVRDEGERAGVAGRDIAAREHRAQDRVGDQQARGAGVPGRSRRPARADGIRTVARVSSRAA